MKQVLILSLILVAPSVLADTYSDPAGDANETLGINHAELDFHSLRVEDRGAQIEFALEVEALTSTQGLQGDPSPAAEYVVSFEVEGQAYQLTFVQIQNAYQDQYWDASLTKAENWTRLVRMDLDENLNEIIGWIPRDWLVGPNDEPVWGASGISEITATSMQLKPFGAQQAVADVLPDTGSHVWLPTQGVVDTDFEIEVLRPLRQSNGGTQAMVFDVRIYGAPSGEYTWSTTTIPQGWEAILPGTTQVTGDEVIEETVFVSIPSGHSHGGLESLEFAMEGASTGRAAVGVSFAQPAFPTAHHPTLYVHSQQFGDVAEGYVNTQGDDPLDHGVPIKFESDNVFGQVLRLPLLPEMGMPLIADKGRSASISASILPLGLDGGPEIQARILWVVDNRTTALWEFPEVSYFSPGPGELVKFSGSATWLPEEDFVDPADGGNMFLEVIVREAGGAYGSRSRTAELHDAEIHLALQEYRPDVERFFAEATELLMESAETQLEAAPGSTLAIPVSVTNLDSTQRDLQFTLETPDGDWSTWSEVDASIGGMEKLSIDIPITLPEDADGLYDFRFMAREGSRLVGVLSFTVLVDDSAEKVTQQARPLAPPEETTAGFSAVLATLAVALAVGRRIG